MEAPNPPVDISVTLGKIQNHQNLLKYDVNISQGYEQIKQETKSRAIPWKQNSNNIFLAFDLYVEQGREQQAVQYLKRSNADEKNLSPLQRIFRQSQQVQKRYKSQITSHQGFVRVTYQIFAEDAHDNFEEVIQQLENFQSSEIDPSCHFSVDMKGSVSHNKKNRQNVKVDYTKFQFQGHKLLSSELNNYIMSFGLLQGQQLQIMNPYLDLIKKSKTIKLNLKFDSFRDIKGYYNSVAFPNDEKKSETKAFPYTNKGIFRQKLQYSLIMRKLMIKGSLLYESEDVFIRLIKVYGKAFNEIFQTDLIYG